MADKDETTPVDEVGGEVEEVKQEEGTQANGANAEAPKLSVRGYHHLYKS